MPSIILVSPFEPMNVGSVSRIMLNFGLTDLRIVNPQCNILDERAKTLAVGSLEVLENARVFTTLQECCNDLHRVIATTARSRDMVQVIHTPATAAAEALDYSNSRYLPHNTNKENEVDSKMTPVLGYGNVGILFGRERGGLTNDEMLFADSTIHIPTFEHYEVLNLAQAVNIIGYELWMRKLHIELMSPQNMLVMDPQNESSPLNESLTQDNNDVNLSSTTVTTSKIPLVNQSKLKLRTIDQPATQDDIHKLLLRLQKELAIRNYRSISRNNNEKQELKSGVADIPPALVDSKIDDDTTELSIHMKSISPMIRRVIIKHRNFDIIRKYE